MYIIQKKDSVHDLDSGERLPDLGAPHGGTAEPWRRREFGEALAQSGSSDIKTLRGEACRTMYSTHAAEAEARPIGETMCDIVRARCVRLNARVPRLARVLPTATPEEVQPGYQRQRRGVWISPVSEPAR